MIALAPSEQPAPLVSITMTANVSDLVRLANMIGVVFQIVDDYHNLQSDDVRKDHYLYSTLRTRGFAKT